jgi:Ca2+-binding EF-hand superfamily protein
MVDVEQVLPRTIMPSPPHEPGDATLLPAPQLLRGAEPAAQAAQAAQNDGTNSEPRPNNRPAKPSNHTSEARAKFMEIDVDGSGTLDADELAQLVKQLGIAQSSKTILGSVGGEITFETFAAWWADVRETERRAMRRKVKDAFAAGDKNGSGRIDKEEFGKLGSKWMKNLNPPFDLEADWQMSKDKRHGAPDMAYPAFEMWWQERLGVDVPNIPVLPEFMVQQVAEQSTLQVKREQAILQVAKVVEAGAKPMGTQSRSAVELWKVLRIRLTALVKMQRSWGHLHQVSPPTQTQAPARASASAPASVRLWGRRFLRPIDARWEWNGPRCQIYDAQEESRFEITPLPKYIR